MSARYGWCLTGHHYRCPAVTQSESDWRAQNHCGCECHKEEQ